MLDRLRPAAFTVTAALVFWGIGYVLPEARGQILPAVEELRAAGDLSLEVVDRVDRWFLDETARLRRDRSFELFRSAAGKSRLRERLTRVLGLKDSRITGREFELVATRTVPALVAESPRIRILSVRWPVLEGVFGEGLLLEPTGPIRAHIVALPDADQLPEELAGLRKPAVGPANAWARTLAEAGCRVVIPTLIDRHNDFSGNPRVLMTNQSHREWIYRQAYYNGRHILGYEIHKVQAACDLLRGESGATQPPLGLAGQGEGGLLALYAAALDDRVDRLLISGAFEPWDDLWTQPIERNVWSLLRDFGAAEVLALASAPIRVIEACRGPELAGTRGPREGTQSATGRLSTPVLAEVEREFARARNLLREQADQFEEPLESKSSLSLIVSDGGGGPAGSSAALDAFLHGIAGMEPVAPDPVPLLPDRRDRPGQPFDPAHRLRRQFVELVDFTQAKARLSVFRRAEFWATADTSGVDRWRETTRAHREQFRTEILGESPPPSVPPRPRARVIYRTAKFTGYEVTLDLWPEVFAYGILLVPSDIPAGGRKPVVVAQHGRGGRPQDVCDPERDTQYYHSFGARLAERGFVVFAPQNLYLGEEKYRQMQRKGIAIGQTFFAPMVRMHERILDWLRELPFVDPDRIGFYGLSYGGKSAMFLPAAIEGYALSICSGDFNEEVWKHTSLEHRFSFQFTNEHDHSEFDTADTFNYAELAGLIAPRPFLVERGHSDGVGIDEWVAYEYARARRRYLQLGIGERTDIAWFAGGHEIRLETTLPFLERQLRNPAPR